MASAMDFQDVDKSSAEAPGPSEQTACSLRRKYSTLDNGKFEETFGIESRPNHRMLKSKMETIQDLIPDSFTVVIKNNIKIKVKSGRIEQQETDVIVNSSSRHLRIGGFGILNRRSATYAISKAIGSEAKEALRKKYPDGIKLGEVAIGEGGDLKCKKVFHVAIKKFRASKQEARLETLKKAVNTCLSEAEKRRYESISFPAIGAGNHGYPANLVAGVLLECFVNHAIRPVQSVIRKIIIITGINEGGPVEKEFHSQIEKRKLHLIDIGKKHRLIPDPQWLCYSYLHITTRSRRQISQVVKRLAGEQDSDSGSSETMSANDTETIFND